MINLWQLYENGEWVELLLILAIIVFIVASFILYLLIIRSRSKNIKREKLRIDYGMIIEKLMFMMIFENVRFSVIKEDKNYKRLSKTTFFRDVIIETIINLHKNYEGIYAYKLEQFYKESGLINDSLRKLRSSRWEVKCKGITELAEMNVTKVFHSLISVSKARNKTLKITAINDCIKLAGIKGIMHLAAHTYPIDAWTQINIINAFKKHDIGDTKGVELLLESQNTTVVSLGLKLIKELKLTQKIPYVVQLVARTPNTLLKYEAENVLLTLTV